MKRFIHISLLIFFLAVLSCLPLSNAQEGDEFDDIIYEASALEMTLLIDNGFELVPQGTSYRIDSVRADMMRFPYPSRSQEIISLETQPPFRSHENDTLQFTWIKPQSTEFDFSLRSTIRTTKQYAKIRNINPLPISVPSELEVYVQPSTTIDSEHPAIIQKARELQKDHDTLYGYTIAAADWVHSNIQYNLSTMTADASQQASWVLENQKGVCDEITSLFMALLRSQGIPTRFISGPAYSNVIGDWESHGWAEVYFPENGWVPFDVTFGQFGYIDAGHIALQQQIDPTEFSITYEWAGRNVKFTDRGSDFNTTVHSYAMEYELPFNTSLRPVHGSVGFGSINQIEYKVTNTKDYHISFSAHLSDTQYVELLSERQKRITLAPFETRYYYWTVKVDEQLDPSFSYSFPLVVSASHGSQSTSSFRSTHTAPTYQQESFTQLQKEASQRFERNDEITFLCKPSDVTISLGENVQFDCRLKNDGVESMNGIEVCFKERCQDISPLRSGEERKILFDQTYTTPKQHAETFSVSAPELFKSSESAITALDKPQLNLENIILPSEVDYTELFEMRFDITKDSFSSASNATLLVFVNKIPVEWELGDITKTRDLSVTLDTTELTPGENDIDIVVTYNSWFGESFTETAQKKIHLREPEGIQKIELFFNQIEQWFKLLFLKTHEQYFDAA